MADYGPSDEPRPDNYHRGRGQQNRPPFRGRGRGRGRGDNRFHNVQRTLNDLQVSDLREHLDRKHLHEQIRYGPPSEPSYSYSRDYIRDDYNQPPKGPNVQRSNSYSSRRGRGRPQYQEGTFIQNPLNIKVQVSAATGHRNCSIDEDATLLNIKHIPDTQFSFLHERPRGTRSVRARGTRFSTDSASYGGQVRAKSTERRHDGFYENRGSRVRSKSVEARGDTSGGRGRGNYRGRGRGDNRSTEWESQIKDNDFRNKFRGRGTGRGNRRGRGGHQYNTPNTELQTWSNEIVAEENREPRNRVRGRGVGRGNRRGSLKGQQYNTPHTESEGDNNVASEENWDIDASREASVNKNVIETKLQDQQEDNQEHSEESELQDYAEEQLEDTESSVEEEKVVIEENLVVTSSLESKNKKRTVRFKEEGRNDDRNEVKDNKDIQQTEETKG